MGQPQNNQGKQKQGEQQSGQPRDARKELGERNRTQGENDPQSGEKSPQDPANRLTRGGTSDDPNAENPERKDDAPAWFTALPPEIRDAIDAGRGEEIPARYRELVRRYNLWLQKQRARDR